MTKSDLKKLESLDKLISWYTENKPEVKRIAVTTEQFKILKGKPYKGFEIYRREK